jgi:hypothetical protein
MMTLNEIHVLEDRRIAAILWTLRSLEAELAKICNDRNLRNPEPPRKEATES